MQHRLQCIINFIAYVTGIANINRSVCTSVSVPSVARLIKLRGSKILYFIVSTSKREQFEIHRYSPAQCLKYYFALCWAEERRSLVPLAGITLSFIEHRDADLWSHWVDSCSLSFENPHVQPPPVFPFYGHIPHFPSYQFLSLCVFFFQFTTTGAPKWGIFKPRASNPSITQFGATVEVNLAVVAEGEENSTVKKYSAYWNTQAKIYLSLCAR